MFVALLLVSLLVARIIDVQGLRAARYAADGNAELYEEVTLPALRGSVYDRDGNDLHGRGLYLDMTPWQASMYSLTLRR